MTQTELLLATIEDLQRRMKEMERAVNRLQRVEAVGGGPISEANVSNPPTAVQLTAALGSPANISPGMPKFVDDNGAGTSFYQVVSDGTFWWTFTGIKAP